MLFAWVMIHVRGNSLGPLSLTTVLGHGGMGLVWNAFSSGSDQPFAVKMPTLAAAGARARFDREADILGQLDNVGVVKLRDRGETDGGVPFVVMDRIPGRALDRILARKRMLTVRETVSILVPLLHTLSEVHRAGVSHRDIKPSNIMVHRSASSIRITLIDFGIAGIQGDLPPAVAQITGTVHYMSPEQAGPLGLPIPQSDLWSVGVVAYECLTGRMPFDGRTLNDVLMALDRGVFPPVSRFRPDLGDEVAALFARAFGFRLEDRFTTAAAMLDALAALPWTDDHVPSLCRAACPRRRGREGSRTDVAPPRMAAPSAGGEPGPDTEVLGRDELLHDTDTDTDTELPASCLLPGTGRGV